MLLNPKYSRKLAFLFYRSRFFGVYVLVGVVSIGVEFIFFRALTHWNWPVVPSQILGVLVGIFAAYWGNVRFNFKVPPARRNRALLYFVSISSGSWALQYLFRHQLEASGWSYEGSRILVSGSLFFIAYILHRRFTFRDYKKVAVAVYANGIEDIKGIFEKIGPYPDIIHVDIVDETFGPDRHDTRLYRLEVIKAYWPHHPIHVHLMSRFPSRYLQDLLPWVDRIYLHVESEEDLRPHVEAIRKAHREAGLAILMGTPLEKVRPWVKSARGILVLSIEKPGFSGQPFLGEALDRVSEIESWDERKHLDLCVDGGISEKNVGLIRAEIVVSGSSVLAHANPRRQVMRLQTSSSYERT